MGAGFVGNTPTFLQLETIEHSGGVSSIPVKGSEASQGGSPLCALRSPELRWMGLCLIESGKDSSEEGEL